MLPANDDTKWTELAVETVKEDDPFVVIFFCSFKRLLNLRHLCSSCTNISSPTVRILNDKVDTWLCNYKPSVHGGYATYFVVSQTYNLTICVSISLEGLLRNLRPFKPTELEEVYD
jgi:hypothetical protein